MADAPELPDEEWPSDDLEQAYRQALQANEAIEWEIQHDAETPQPQEADDAHPNQGESATAAVEFAQPELPSGNGSDHDNTALKPRSSADTGSAELRNETGSARPLGPRVTPRQIVEAALFVGGAPLTTRKLLYAVRGDFDHSFIEDLIDDLNRQYAEEGRPYEIRLSEGGYRLTLRHEFERVRNRVYGFGPKEVKLSQEALEVLALVAYRQPISKHHVEELGKKNAGGVLRQLLRRELITIERGQGNRKDVKYHTTSRFLSVFGLRSLDELPQADDLDFK